MNGIDVYVMVMKKIQHAYFREKCSLSSISSDLQQFQQVCHISNENMQQIVFTARIDSVINVYNVHQIFFWGGEAKFAFYFHKFHTDFHRCVRLEKK